MESSPLRSLDPDKAEQLKALFAALSDLQIAELAPAMKTVGARTGVARAACELLQNEQADRRVRDLVFAPLAPVVRQGADDPLAPLPPDALTLLWRALRRHEPEMAQTVVAAATDLTEPDEARRACDAAALACAAWLETAEGGWAALREALDARRPDGAEALRSHLALAPLVRACTPRVRAWMRTASAQHASALKLAYRDAAALGDEAPPRLIDMLAAQLDQEWQVLRLISAVMDRPNDGFLAASELGRFGERMLDEVDDRVQSVRGFDPGGGIASGRAAAEAVCDAVMALSEFDRSVDLRPDGAWARRISAQRRNLSRGVETRLRQADGALAKALPVVGSGFAGRLRGAPRLDVPADPMAQNKAGALAAFAAGVRAGADYGGFAVARAKAIEALDTRLSLYADDLVRAAHECAPPEADEARRRLGFVAECLGLIRDAKAADLIRRRAAAA